MNESNIRKFLFFVANYPFSTVNVVNRTSYKLYGQLTMKLMLLLIIRIELGSVCQKNVHEKRLIDNRKCDVLYWAYDMHFTVMCDLIGNV